MATLNEIESLIDRTVVILYSCGFVEVSVTGTLRWSAGGRNRIVIVESEGGGVAFNIYSVKIKGRVIMHSSHEPVIDVSIINQQLGER